MIGDIRTIIKGYAQGYFLMDNGNGKLDWYCSKKRALIPLDERFRYPKSLRRALNQERFAVAINKDFPAVCAGCAARPSTWISPELLAIYLALHEAGWAHSFETWQGNKLAGGILGIVLRGAFIGESMFYQVPEASKVVMIKLYDKIGRTFTPAQLPPLRCSNPKPPLGTFRRSQSFATTSFNSFLLFPLVITNPG